MGISSLGVGSSVLTQDVIDQLKEVDEKAQIQPITFDIANENDKKDVLDVINASMDNLSDSIKELTNHSMYDKRIAEATGTAVEVTALDNTDVQDFTLKVDKLATKEIQESGTFDAEDDAIADGDGTLTLTVGDQTFDIDYTDETTLKDLKKMINDVAGDSVNATIGQVNDGEYNLFLTSVETGENQDISIADSDDGHLDSKITDLNELQDGENAEFTFNGQSGSRESNEITDLVTGVSITLKELGTSDVSVKQDREEIFSRVDSFVEKFNSSRKELDKDTNPSKDSDEKGIFSSESTIKNMNKAIADLFDNLDTSSGTLYDYGFDIDKDGFLSVDSTKLEKKLDEDPDNFEAFFAGGTYTDSDGNESEIDGAFTQMSTTINSYTDYGGTLDTYKDSITAKISDLEDLKTSRSESLDARYEIMQKKFASYDIMIARYNSTADMFTQMMDAEDKK